MMPMSLPNKRVMRGCWWWELSGTLGRELANERTLLAWIRTALTLIGGGVAIEAFAGTALSFVARRGLALALVCLGMLLAAASCYRWVSLERAMRQEKPLPLNPIALVLAAGVTVAAALLAWSIAVQG